MSIYAAKVINSENIFRINKEYLTNEFVCLTKDSKERIKDLLERSTRENPVVSDHLIAWREN